MDTARIRRELVGSIRLLWTEELWLWSGAVTVLASFMLWVGATGAALAYGTDFAGIDLSVFEWSSATTVALAVVAVLWVLAPAALVTYLVSGSLTNVRGNLHTHYRVEHPTLLVLPFLVLYAVGAGAGVAVGSVPVALIGGLAVFGLLALVRTVAYSYRVFSFSVPLLAFLFLFVSLSLVAVTVLTGVGILAGREAFVAAAVDGVGDLLGVGSLAGSLLGPRTVGPVTVPTLPALTSALPAVAALGYVLVQSVFGAVARLREPDAARSNLRTGQRYPAFAHPGSRATGDTTSRSGSTDSATRRDASGGTDSPHDAASPSGSSGTTAAASDPGEDTDEDETEETVSHTKVFTAPEDGDFDDAVPGVDDVSGADDEETAVVGAGGPGGEETAVSEGGYRCPTCADQFDSDTDFAYCPTCGTELETQ